MTKKKVIEASEDKILPKALVIGASLLAGYLSRLLTERGCSVEVIQSPSQKILLRFDYVFQFGGIEFTEGISQTNLVPGGKLLFIETESEEIKEISPGQKYKIIRVGDSALWDISQLAEKILKTMFSTDAPFLVDVRKKSPLSKTKTSIVDRTSAKSQLTNKKKENLQELQAYARNSPTPLAQQDINPKRNKSISKKLLFLCFFLGAIFLAILGSGYWYFSSLQKSYDNFRSHLASGDYFSLMADLKETRAKLDLGRSFYGFTSTIFFPFKNTAFMQDIGEIFTLSDNLLKTSEEVLSFPEKFRIEKTGNFLNTADFTATDFENLKTKINNLGTTIISAKQKMEETSLPLFPKESLSIFLGGFYTKLINIHQILPIFEEIFTSDKTRTYLVLFQNNMELRPTGGFIGSFALLKIANGKILDFNIMDVYTADGQLTGHVEPPAPIRKYLSQPNYFLRDSNFDPDFAAAGNQTSWFLQKELGVKVDGVIGVNLLLAQNLLSVFGPLTLPDFNNEQVSADNFFFKAQFYAQKDFFAGSTQKKDFLTAVAKAMEIKLTTGGNLPWFELLTVVKNALDEKNLLFYTTEEKMQKLVEERGWGGRMSDVSCLNKSQMQNLINNDLGKTCFADYLSIIEANLGVNKANYFVNKSTAVEKKIETNGQITNTVTISYENKSLSQVFSGGIYVNYLRFLTPVGSKLLSATFNNVPIPSTELDTESYPPDKTVFGFLVKIAPENKGIVKIVYALSKKFTIETSSYQFLYQKQGGDKTSPLILSVILPSGLKLKPTNFNSSSSRENEIYFTADTSVDRIFALEKN